MSAAALNPPQRPFREIDISETDEGTTGGVIGLADGYGYGLTHVKTGVEVRVLGYHAMSYARSACLGALAVAVWVYERQRDIEADTYIRQAEEGSATAREHVERLGLVRYEGEHCNEV